HAIAARSRFGHHLLERGHAIARDRSVYMKIAEDAADRPRQSAALGGLDLATVLAQDRRDPGQTERAVDLLLRFAGDRFPSLDLRERIFIERPSPRQRALAKLDVVPFRAREIELGRAKLLRLDHAQVDLCTATSDYARLGLARTEHTIDDAHRHE